ncbi:VOC family protein [Thalassotalea atypica]|uniref:VOC family protein n=1 Tax=Thalassotalea atypica TaxID=2054316 RepID=UPI002572AEC2|nr:VOC family protein [Thalassotalea atypica]
MMENQQTGEQAWLDLTVDNAEEIKSFYQDVIGWKSEAVSMGEYEDFTMISAESRQAVSGICHARGGNKDLPPMWLPYFLVEDVASATEQVKLQGGHLVTPIKTMGKDKYVVIKDPAGAACALYQKG